jgi:hypothetical protein
MPNKNRSFKRNNKRSKKRVRFGGAKVIETYSDPIINLECKDSSCKLRLDDVIIKDVSPEFQKLITKKTKNNLSDELKIDLGLTIEELHNLAKCSLEEIANTSSKNIYKSKVFGISHEFNKYLTVEVYKINNNRFDVVLYNKDNETRYKITELKKEPEVIAGKFTNEKKIQLGLDLHKLVELKRECRKKEVTAEADRQRLAAEEARVAAEAYAKTEAERLKKKSDEAADIERRRIEEADRAAAAAADAKRIADEAKYKAAEVARKLKEQEEAEKRRKEEAAVAKAAEVAEKARLERIAKEDQDRLAREEREREKEVERERKQATVAAAELERQRVAAFREKEEALKEADRLKRVADEKDKEEKAATLAADRAAENERRAQEKRAAEEAARQKQEAADALVKEAKAEANKAAALVAKAAEASRAEAARREKDAAATQSRKCKEAGEKGAGPCRSEGCTYHSKTRECLPPGVQPKKVGHAQSQLRTAVSHPLAQQPKDRCSERTPWQCLVHVMKKINKSFGSLFSSADTDKNDSVSRTEFTVAMNTHIKELDNAKINVVFDLLDLDNDNKLSYNELKSLDKLSYAILMKMSPKEIQEKFPTVRQAISTPAYVSETARVLGNMPKTQYTTGSRGGGKKNKTRKNKRSKVRSQKKRKTKNN